MSMEKPIIIVSGPVIIENGKVLLDKQGDDDFWKFCGGRVHDYSVSLEERAVERAKEELGIKVEVIRPLKPMMVEMPEKVVVLIHYLANRIGEVKPGEDIKEWDWIDIHDLPKDIAPNINPVIDEYLKNSKPPSN